MRGGDTSKFTEAFNSFEKKDNDFQSWIDTLTDDPYIVGGNLDEIHDALTRAITLGDHKINVASDFELTDDQWRARLSALEEAYNYKSSIIVEEDTTFTQASCQLSCGEGELDLAKCECNDCNQVSKCCGLNANRDPNQIYVHLFIS